MKTSKFQLTLSLALACATLAFSLAVRAQAQTVSNLADFDYYQNGSRPVASVVQATDGNFYGVTQAGGPYAGSYGTFYRVTPGGKITDLYNFCSQPKCADGATPFSAPILGVDANLYGVTPDGGSDAAVATGSGTVYRMTLGGAITTLYTFCRVTPCPDGQYPNGIVLAADGNFYSTTLQGGEFNHGEVFKITPDGKLTVLHSFCSHAKCTDGSTPDYPPIQGSDGNFYGTTSQGGTDGVGVVYELTAAGDYTVLHSFCSETGCPDGWPPATIVQDANGNLFGTTQTGIGAGFYGTVFEITPKNRYTVLHTFNYVGANPDAALTIGNDGNLYGIGEGNGTPETGGVIFEITPAGLFTQLHAFSDCSASGYIPISALFQGTDGIFYGTTLFGGHDTSGGCSGDGTIFSLSNGLDPFVKTVPVAGPVGKHVLILGNGLTGSSSVTFNGVEAAFTVESDTYIKATVPKGATTGTVSVITPSGTLNSNPQFVINQ